MILISSPNIWKTITAVSKHIQFDRESCYRRWALLDLSATETNAREEFVFPSTEKALSFFANRDGQRKTIEELRRNETENPVTFAPKLPDTEDSASEEGDNIYHVHPSELWENLGAKTE
eukprot:CAMPEP_0181132368 /NCGR_PEP_ID=MMETSP1071-20121207/30957_1 /TAXON_ID=35127 /ORGANISM="Thalassiosira sp., Strain NH16" /LENGTH=118 /DNA_ID=CAMNT_0023218695 /DNA_START=32 /DNA_END=388 /DNA_ORIENTATION=+